MIVSYINSEQRHDHVRVTFIGRDGDDKPRRPVVDLDSHDLATLVEIAKAFRAQQKRRAAEFTARANRITETGLLE